MKANHNASAVPQVATVIERTLTKIKVESKSQLGKISGVYAFNWKNSDKDKSWKQITTALIQ